MSIKKYFLMHKERHVATICSDGLCRVFYPSFMPYSLYLDVNNYEIENRLNNLNNFYHWCSSRVLTLDRKYAKEIFNALGKKQATTDKNRAEIALSYKCLSLTDVFWVKDSKEKVNFRDVNLYQHSLSDAFVDICLKGKTLTVENFDLQPVEVAGNISPSGLAPKAWIRKNNKFLLYKDGNKRDVDAEILASKIIDCFKINHVSYQEGKYNNEKVSICENITSEDKSIISMEYMDIYCVNKNIDLKKFVLSKDAYSYYMMNIVDYLVGNTDRHWGNWGFLVDNNNNKILKLYDLMDYNKSFTSYDNIEGSKCLTLERNKTQKDAAIEAVKQIGLNQIKDIDNKIFFDDSIKEMFYKRITLLKEYTKQS